MANRRIGGMGGPQRGNRSFSQHQPFQGSNVSPWQGNMPSNNSVNQGLFSQLATNPQQLALALTSLLQPQQQQMNNPPSLLSLNPSPAFSHEDRDLNRFGNRGGRDFRRHEPYNKNRNGGWRPMDNNRNRNNNRNQGINRDNQNKKQNTPARKMDRKDANKKAEKPAVKPTPNKTDKVDTIDLSMDETRDEEVEETKRDWKEEKNTTDDSEKKEESGDEEEKKKTDEQNRAGKYFDVPVKLLHCFVCNKEMWDGESMQKHVKGRAHKQMLSSLEENIHITVNILRENMRVTEEKKVIEWSRMHRLKKFNTKFNEPESHCNMCDLKFLGKIITHRKTESHQRLKRYLHPNCDMCVKEFPSRIEWVEHRLTPEHMRKMNEVMDSKLGEENGAIIADEELDLEPLLEESLQMESEVPVLELTDDLAGLQNLIPAYKEDRAVSTLSLKPFTGFLCELCQRSFESEEIAKEHLKSRRHYYAFVEAAKAKYQRKENDKKKPKDDEKAADVEGKEAQNGEADAEMYDPEEACNEGDVAEKTEEDVGDPSVVNLDAIIAESDVTMNEVPAEEEVEEAEPEVKEAAVVAPVKPEATPPRATRRASAAVTKVANKPCPKSKKTPVRKQ